MDGPVFRGYVKWNDLGEDGPSCGSMFDINSWLLERLPYKVIISSDINVALQDVGDSVLDDWSAYCSMVDNTGHYFFKTKEDAMAFKLRWL